MNRRRFLQLTGASALTGLAGCGGSIGSSPTETTTPSVPETTRQTTANSTETTDPSVPEAYAELRTDYRSRERFRSPGASVTTFDDLTNWLDTDYGSATGDPKRAFVGEQSLKLEGTAGSSAVVERPVPPTDLSDVDFSFALYTPDPGKFSLFVRLIDTSGKTAVLELRSLTEQPPNVGWFRTAPGCWVADDGVDLSRVNRFQIEVHNATDQDVVAWIDDLRVHPKPKKGYVILSWDDGTPDFYEDAAPMNDEHGFPSVVTMTPLLTKMGEPGFMSEADFVERNQAGDEIIAHGSVEKTFEEMSREELERVLVRHKQWLSERGFGGKDFIVYPANHYDAPVLDVVGNYHYAGGFNQSGSVNTTAVYGFDPLALPRTIGHDLDIAKRLVDQVATYRNCGILNFHRFDSRNTMSERDYGRLLNYIDRKGDAVEVITLSDLWEMRKAGQDKTVTNPFQS